MRCFCVLTNCISLALAVPQSQRIKFILKNTSEPRILNVDLQYTGPFNQAKFFTYGACDTTGIGHEDRMIEKVSSSLDDESILRLVWAVPDDAPATGCISAWTDDNILVSRSEPLSLHEPLHRMSKRHRIPMTNVSGIDAEGPWFDGVARIQNLDDGTVDANEEKRKSIGIIGAGIAGLTTYYLLHSVGFSNLEICESTDRLGGRIRTEYFDLPEWKYQYQEMGAMRVPVSENIQLGNQSVTLNWTFHELVFQLANALNTFNQNDNSFHVNWIPFIEYSNNALSLVENKRLPDGSNPTISDIAQNSSLGADEYHDTRIEEIMAKVNSIYFDPQMLKLTASNIFRAHKKFIDSGLNGTGGDDWSRTEYLHEVLGFDLNLTDFVNTGNSGLGSFRGDIFEKPLFMSENTSTWKTIDGGMSRLPSAFKPLIGDRIKYRRKIQKVQYTEAQDKVQVSWKNHYKDHQFQNVTYDYAFIAAPFSVVRKWEIPKFSPTLAHAIGHLGHGASCKVVLQFKTRFWEHLSRPIFGSCNTNTDVPGIKVVCYPSFNLNGTGPAIVIASYTIDDYAFRWPSTPEEEHAQYVLDAFAKLHGDIAYEHYTGNYKRVCWAEEESTGGAAWASPTVGQHKMYMPAYFNVENNIIFIGEHTSYTHGWMASGIESAIRGTVQLLLEMGLVDEAKNITKTWMGKWVTA